MLFLPQIYYLKRYKIILKESGHQVHVWGNVIAPDALQAINKVCLSARPYQEWVARELSYDN